MIRMKQVAQKHKLHDYISEREKQAKLNSIFFRHTYVVKHIQKEENDNDKI